MGDISQTLLFGQPLVGLSEPSSAAQAIQAADTLDKEEIAVLARAGEESGLEAVAELRAAHAAYTHAQSPADVAQAKEKLTRISGMKPEQWQRIIAAATPHLTRIFDSRFGDPDRTMAAVAAALRTRPPSDREIADQQFQNRNQAKEEDMSKNVFLTGATGFIGAGLAVHYLRQGHTVYALCRGGDPARVERALTSVDPTEKWRNDKLHVVPGDVTLDDVGLTRSWSNRLNGGIDLVLHAAGHIKFEDEDPLNMEINFLGSQRMARVAKEMKWGRFIYISTSYVWGTSTGWLDESLVSRDHAVHNGYEYSKIQAEHAVLETFDGRATIVRPSIVVGALGDGWEGSTPVTFAGYYGYFKGFDWLRRQMKTDGGVLDLETMRIPGDPSAEINIIPIDNLVGMIVSIADDPASEGGIFHAVHPHGPLYEPLVRQSLEVMGISGGRIILPSSPEAESDLTPVEALIRGAVRPFLGYVGEQRRFKTDQMGRFYDVNKVPRIGPEEVRRLLKPATKCRFRPVDRR